jgi:hypothetical protein
MTNKKSFFNERTAAEILKMDLKRVDRAKGLVNRILGLDPGREALQLMVQITPGRFYVGGLDSTEASRKCFKHGELIALSQPTSEHEALASKEIPLAVRMRDFAEKLEGWREEDINFVGYSWRPVVGEDRKRIVPFVFLPQAVQLFGYSEGVGGIEVKSYDDSRRVRKEGATIVCEVPSRTPKHPRYKVTLQHVPVDNGTEKRAVVWGLKHKFDAGEEPGHTTFSDIRYTWESGRESSDVIRFNPHSIVAYIAVIKHYNALHNLTPLEMNQFALPSKLGADFYKKITNNLVIFDPTLTGKQKFRKLHLDEKSILFGRFIGNVGAHDSVYWDPARDGRLKDYDWSIPNS